MKYTNVIFVLDESGSMTSTKNLTINSFNEQLQSLQSAANTDHEVRVSFVKFSDSVKAVFYNKLVSEVEPLNTYSYNPNGLTALYDAVGTAITSARPRTLKHPQEEINEAFLVVIFTDGAENASKVYKSEQIVSMVKEAESTGKWTVTYMGSNVDLNTVQAQLGFLPSNASLYGDSVVGRQQAGEKMTRSLSTYMSARADGLTASTSFYTTDDGTPQD